MNIQKIRELLEEIAEGKGPYSRDHLQHAGNCIEAMKKCAREALEELGKTK